MTGNKLRTHENTNTCIIVRDDGKGRATTNQLNSELWSKNIRNKTKKNNITR